MVPKKKAPKTLREKLWNSLLVARGTTADESDEALAVVATEGEVVGEISRADRYRIVVWQAELIGKILDAAETVGAEAVARLLSGCGRH